MDHRNTTPRTVPPAASAGMDHSEELLAEVDEPPDERRCRTTWAPPKLQHYPSFNKGDPRIYQRRESLLTRQLHSETEQTDEESAPSHPPPRALSTQSTCSNPSVASTAELTSDDGHSLASPAISPPLPPTAIASAIPITEKPLSREPKILSQEEKLAEPGSEQSVEAGLGRKRCISFACGNKQKTVPTSQPKQTIPEVSPKALESSSPPKRKCTIKFAGPTGAGATRPAVERTVSGRRLASPPPPERKLARVETATKVHRGSDSTVTHVSPQSTRKSSPSSSEPVAAPISIPVSRSSRRLSNDSQASTEATRFHEFASSEGEPEEWVQESTCYKSRLTVNDTLQKEITIRKACEEVEEEALEEEDEDDEIDEDEDDVDEDDDLDEDDDDLEHEEESDDGFKTDDEDGFAESDSEGEESDEDWWRPGGRSTAATSVDHFDRINQSRITDAAVLASSVGSASSSHITPSALLKKARSKSHAHGVTIQHNADSVDLPDSTDFVCGTLDEDRPLEQAFLNHRKQREAAKHKVRPQDIDPTFPTSDPDMDEEDDEDLEDPEESERESFMHGNLEDLDGDFTLRRRPSKRDQRPTAVHRSPPPPARHRSPAPGMLKRTSTARSPPPPARHRSPPPPARHRSPGPGQLKKGSTARSPPPARRGTARSPPPRKLFANSPTRDRSPAPFNRMTSPPNTRRVSPAAGVETTPNVLASRPQLTHTASLPRAGGFHLGQFNGLSMDDGEDTETGENQPTEHKRGAIDIYKGLEHKRKRRKEKLYQKACAKAAAKGDKPYKVKPGKGAERMREVGLELQRYRGKGEHILSM